MRRNAAARTRRQRRGNILVLTAVMMVALMAMLAFSLDTGYMYTVKSELQRSVDAAALAGACNLVEGQNVARAAAIEYLVRNPAGYESGVGEGDMEDQMARFVQQHQEDFDVQMGRWDAETRQFEVTDHLPSAINVGLSLHNQPLFFANVLGYRQFDIHAESIAMYQPRDIMLILDFSASMNDDSELSSIDTLGQDKVEANILQMWEELGSPTYGNLEFDPDWVTIPGANLPAEVTWRTTEVDVQATSSISKVRLYFSNGNYQTFYPSQQAGTWEGTGSNSGYRVTKCSVKINGEWETFDFYNNSHIRRGLGLDTVLYPYPDGEWNDYIEYARSHNSSMPWYGEHVYHAGYRRKFGMLTLVNFWNRYKPKYVQTPDLWQVSAQPVTAVKDAVDVFLEYIQEVETDDRVGVAIYNSQSGDSILETGLTQNFDLVEQVVYERQAGHYHRYTNIGAGMEAGRVELDDHGRLGAQKMIVLMTDGKANWVDGDYDTSAAKQYVLDEAQLCADRRYPIVTISLGAGADTQLMEQVAEITAAANFVVPGGQAVAEYSEDLKEVFHDIADDRPLKLVQ